MNKREENSTKKLSLFPKVNESQHFHYENSQIAKIKVILSKRKFEEKENVFSLKVFRFEKSFFIKRSLKDIIKLDFQIHCCLFLRQFSKLPKIEENDSADNNEAVIESYFERFSSLLSRGNALINCSKIIHFFEFDSKGNQLLTNESELNRRAICCAFVVKAFERDDIDKDTNTNTDMSDERLSLRLGELVSVIEIDSQFIKGKKGFQVGFFPKECVQMIESKDHQLQQGQLGQLGQLGQFGSLTIAPNVALLSGEGASFHCAGGARTLIAKREQLKEQPIVIRKHAHNGKIAAFFRSFVSGSTSVQKSRNNLKMNGILRERVFGCDLSEYLFNSGQKIPEVLRICSEFIERKGLLDGIYRLSGISSNIHKLRQLFDVIDEEIDLEQVINSDLSIVSDIHCVSSVLKMFFRELPNPLLTYNKYQEFIQTIQMSDSAPAPAAAISKLDRIRVLVQGLPPHHFATLQHLIRHLNRVSQSSCVTGMTPKNLAIVWAPNLLRCRALHTNNHHNNGQQSTFADLQLIGVQAVLTEFLIQNCDQIFENKDFSEENKENFSQMNTKSTEKEVLNLRVGPEILPKYHTIITKTTKSKEKSSFGLNFSLNLSKFLTKNSTKNSSFKRRNSEKKFSQKSDENLEKEKKKINSNKREIFEEKKEELNPKMFFRSKSFESFFQMKEKMKNKSKIVLNLKINFAKITTLLDEVVVMEDVQSDVSRFQCLPSIDFSLTSASHPITHLTTNVALDDSKTINNNNDCVRAINDQKTIQQTSSSSSPSPPPPPSPPPSPLRTEAEVDCDVTNNISEQKPSLARQRIEKIKENRRQEIFEKFNSNSKNTQNEPKLKDMEKTTSSRVRPTPTPRRASLSSQLSSDDTKRETTSTPTSTHLSQIPVPRPRRTVTTTTTTTTTDSTTATSANITIRTLRTKSYKKRNNNWNNNNSGSSKVNSIPWN